MANTDRELLDVNPSAPVNNPGGGETPLTEMNLSHYRPLSIAALKGDWKTAQRFIDGEPSAVTAKISREGMNVLHVAASAGNEHFVEKVVGKMPEEALSTVDGWGYTALHYAAMGGSKRMAKALIRKKKDLAKVKDVNGHIPLLIAADKELVRYMCWVTEEIFRSSPSHPDCPFTGPLAGQLICFLTRGGFLDISLDLLRRYPSLATAKNQAKDKDPAKDPVKDGLSLLGVLAAHPSNFYSGKTLTLWESLIYYLIPVVEVNHHLLEDSHQKFEHRIQLIIYLAKVVQRFKWLLWKAMEKLIPCDIKPVGEEKLKHKCAVELVKQVCEHVSRSEVEIFSFFMELQSILTVATENGIIEIARECLGFFPDLILNMKPQSLMQVAVKHRHATIFILMSETTTSLNKLLAYDSDPDNNILRMAALLPTYLKHSVVSGSAALQMQKELQLFKEVENFVHPAFKELKFEGQTAWQIFVKEHKKLQEDGEKWMKDTSNYCMLVATLITTVVFAAAYTVPGGNESNDDKKGVPIFLGRNLFIVFAIFDAVALFFSVTSILMFLSILTSRCEPKDFLRSLPNRLIIGLLSLSVAIAGLMVVFGVTLTIALRERWKLIWIPFVFLSLFPVTMFAMLQLPLFYQNVKSTYGTVIFRPKKIW